MFIFFSLNFLNQTNKLTTATNQNYDRVVPDYYFASKVVNSMNSKNDRERETWKNYYISMSITTNVV